MYLNLRFLILIALFATSFAIHSMDEDKFKVMIDKYKLEKSIETLNPQVFSFTMASILAPSAKKTALTIIAHSIQTKNIDDIKYMAKHTRDLDTNFITSGAKSVIQNLLVKIREEQEKQTSEQNLKKWHTFYFTCGIFNAFVATVGIGLIFSGHKKTGVATTCAGISALGKVGYTYKNHNSYYENRTKKAEELEDIITTLSKNL
ncbi:MAG: hypothetical protein BWY54_00028 [Candidatus Dependentiae bacterium ADurb.Bin331]|nr:MAG: hypothetical protein BWY54_00028 [Candidatus Dependentiae bacterium ADurb.Bin331]